ncbi:MAG: hypothetical protein AAGA48_31040 [Myxococcota bacterium]
MSCPHATTTTLLWLYGEADASHDAHVASCAECQAVAADHADVMSAMAEVSHLDLCEDPPAAPRPVNRGWSVRAVSLTAVALAAAAGVLLMNRGPAPEPGADLATQELSALALGDDLLDERFDDLVGEVGELEANVEWETL